jgi:hypothetical protein
MQHATNTRLLSGDQVAALVQVWQTANQSHGASRVCTELLLSLYNGNRFRFDLTDLRLLDASNLQAAITVILIDAARCSQEIHIHLQDVYGETRHFGPEFEHLAHDWRLKGKCKKEWLSTEPRRRPAA